LNLHLDTVRINNDAVAAFLLVIQNGQGGHWGLPSIAALARTAVAGPAGPARRTPVRAGSVNLDTVGIHVVVQSAPEGGRVNEFQHPGRAVLQVADHDG